MIIKRNRANVTKILGVFFFPGVNVIDPEREAEFAENDDFKNLLATKIKGQPIHEIVTEGDTKKVESKKTGEAIESDLAGVNAKEAIAIVKDTLSIDVLEKFAETEERTSVLKAIDKQIEDIKGETEEDEEE